MFKKTEVATRLRPTPSGRQTMDLGIAYRIFTKDDYKRYRLSRTKASSITAGFIKTIEESWEKTSKGYNFIIGVGKEEQLMFYSVEHFNKHVLNGKNKSKALTFKLNLDTTEFEDKLNKIEKKLERINFLERVASRLSKTNYLEATAELEEAFNNIKKVVAYNTYNNSR